MDAGGAVGGGIVVLAVVGVRGGGRLLGGGRGRGEGRGEGRVWQGGLCVGGRGGGGGEGGGRVVAGEVILCRLEPLPLFKAHERVVGGAGGGGGERGACRVPECGPGVSRCGGGEGEGEGEEEGGGRARRRGRVSIRMSGGDSGHTGILVIDNTAPDMAAP